MVFRIMQFDDYKKSKTLLNRIESKGRFKGNNGRDTEIKRVPMNMVRLVENIQNEIISNGNGIHPTWTASAEILAMAIEKRYKQLSIHAKKMIEQLEADIQK